MKTIAIIGAGVVGCALAQELANEYTDIHVFEKNERFGEGITSRNSGVIHSGLYYSPNSLKAKLCIEGQERLYEWCRRRDIPYLKTGKLVVLESFQHENVLNKIYQNALACGAYAESLRILSEHEIKKKNPHIKGVLALHSLNSGIVDPYLLCQSFYFQAIKNGAQFHFNCKVIDIGVNHGYRLETQRGEMRSDLIINAAGLYADEIAALLGKHDYRIFPWRGDYFKINLPYNIDVLVYPAVRLQAAGLGVHLTFDMRSNFFLGPDCEPNSSKNDFTPKYDKKTLFYESACRLLDGISPEMLSYETCGIRPKLRAFDMKEEKDFIISEDLPGFFNLIGIESPGLTASLAIAKFVKNKIC